MSYFDKETYERKLEWALRHNRESSEIGIENGLTEEQSEALEWLCTVRHEMHYNQKDVFYTECHNYSIFNDYIDHEISDRLSEVGLPHDLYWDITEIDDDQWCVDNDCSEEEWDEALDRVYSFMNKVNMDIENFLKKIDKKYKTSYCPTGFTRLN